MTTPRQHKLIYSSSYDRGLNYLLGMWPKIKKKFPDAELHIFYGWDLYDAAYKDNPERLLWKHKMNDDMDNPGITHHGRVSKKELQDWQKKCGIWAYPTDFTETNCITANDCQLNGAVPCTMALAGLKESVQSGVIIPGEIVDELVQDTWLDSLFDLMSDEEYWKEEQVKGKKHALNCTWDKVADKWGESL